MSEWGDRRMNGFISYAHADRRQFELFHTHLKSVERGYPITFWSDKRLNAGYRWGAEIRQRIAEADVFILLVSSAFFASSYIVDHELPAIRERRKVSDNVLVLPVVLEPCYWQLIGGHLHVVPSEGGTLKPIIQWHPRVRGHDRAREAISNTIQAFYGLSPTLVEV